MGEDMNDYDSIAHQIEKARQLLAENTHSPMNGQMSSDSVTTTKEGWIACQVELARLICWVKGLAEAHRAKDDG